MKVKVVFALQNGMVAVFDYVGEQVAELQGRFEDVKDKVLDAADDGTEFNGWPGIPDGGRIGELRSDEEIERGIDSIRFVDGSYSRALRPDEVNYLDRKRNQ